MFKVPRLTQSLKGLSEPSMQARHDHSVAGVQKPTRGLGFVGRHTCLELLKSGYNVIIVDDLSNSFYDIFGKITTLPKRHFYGCGGLCSEVELYP
ncbi:UDP-GAL-4-epimerase [Drepanopeziza brunnea f. sp. 'multigermtubi' MB_m1]|uniref:UDP-GAL-4-epimerase n=1 Tax=Marssonina brunnea f. sp. multigermtubi (strain MB_m1) TaxID=1072389 RepID=K1WMB4_MARBU|nr:UDP-GAL-4-epimerase [Drepanopeziza brunnea f. sp. 'multigermtubi' MB_m1]EKD13472.1 UDP-GAL-4-epimerase [Drepanopeziza brunnea f. sp. 'multigermtubi' MB_m1]